MGKSFLEIARQVYLNQDKETQGTSLERDNQDYSKIKTASSRGSKRSNKSS